ncbi:MAG: rhomboid family intramembrane serine protease [Terriglobales bacterium]
MIPLRDDQPTFSTPFVNYFLIVLNVLVFLWERAQSPRALSVFVRAFGLVPSHTVAVLTGHSHDALAAGVVPLFTSLFLHGSLLHVVGNMLFLWIFGDNVEDYLGHFSYLIFYLASGLAASFTHILLNLNSHEPTIGASGAIAGVMGAYFIVYPRARVLTWFFVFIVWLPAWLVLGYWFLLQFFAFPQFAAEGVAVWAHLGGFAAGVMMIKLFPERRHRYRYGTW